MDLRTIDDVATENPSEWASKNIEQYLRSDGEHVQHPMADRMILLYTKGRKTGKIRRTPIVHLPDGDDLIVIASKGGAPKHPEWFLNLRGDPQVWVRRKSEVFEAGAEILEGDEYEEMWRRVTDWAPGFQTYQDRTERRIPLVRLTPVRAA
ncbi:MAG: nitroreductase family deazaflavin-dependent oxidoreductase [Acidimicrobiia bacterium]